MCALGEEPEARMGAKAVRDTAEQQISKVAEEEGRACACGNLRKAARAVTKLFDEALRPAGLRATQFGIL